jgi:hypothetical protein
MTTLSRRGICAAVILSVLVGCGPTSRHALSGRITHDGRPIAAGRIIFQPDPAKGNDGPGGVADIKDGHYQTKSGMGAVSGPHLARITAGDGVGIDPVMRPYGAVQGEFVVPVDLPAQSGTVDLEIPVGK